jgi:microcompartment protein CcmK/EutM
MMLGRVVGNVVATVKHDALAGRTLLLIQPITRDGKDRGRALVAVDAVGAGYRETVYWCRGKEASLAFDGAEVPADDPRPGSRRGGGHAQASVARAPQNPHGAAHHA